MQFQTGVLDYRKLLGGPAVKRAGWIRDWLRYLFLGGQVVQKKWQAG